MPRGNASISKAPNAFMLPMIMHAKATSLVTPNMPQNWPQMLVSPLEIYFSIFCALCYPTRDLLP